MPIPVICLCKAKLKVADHLLGGQITCPECGKGQAVPAPGPDHPYFNLYTPPAQNHAPAALLSFPSPKQVLKNSDLAEDERERLTKELEENERLLWVGRPDLRIAFGRAWAVSAGIYAGAVIVLIGLIIVLANFGLSGLPFWLALVGLGVTSIGMAAYATFYPYYRRWLTAKQFYTITDQRATLWGCGYFGKPAAPWHFKPAALSGMRRRPTKYWGPQAGDLVFASQTKVRGSGKDAVAVTTIWGFLMLRNAVEVEKILREALLDPLLDKIYE